MNYAVSPDLTLQYDALNRLTNLVDAVGTTHYTYNAVGQLLSEDGPWANDTISYSYSQRQHTGTSLLQPNASAWSVAYAYDAARRLTNVTSEVGAFDYDYDVTAKLQPWKLALPGGSQITNTFDSVARLTATALSRADEALLNLHAYEYNAGNQRTKQTFTAGNYVDYTYDNIGQLKTAKGKESGGTERLQEKLGYAYDAAGNLQYRTNNALLQTFTVNVFNQPATLSRSGTYIVAGVTSEEATSVTVNIKQLRPASMNALLRRESGGVHIQDTSIFALRGPSGSC